MESLWLATTPGPRFAPLDGDALFDVLIVGGGITGVTAAALLAATGRSVAIVEMRRIAGGESGRTTAHLTEMIDARYRRLRRKLGSGRARAVAESSRAAIDRIERFVRDERLACGFARVPGWLYADREEDVKFLREEQEAAAACGVRATLTADAPLPFPVRAALRVDDQAQFHPREYLLGLLDVAVRAGCRVFENTQVRDVEDGAPCRVRTEGGTIAARDVVVATNVPISNRFAIHTKIAAYRSYALATREAQLPPAGLYWDSADPYHYVRRHSTPDGEYLIVGGEDHKVGKEPHTHEPFARLEAWARARFDVRVLEYKWSGQIIEPADGLPFIGLNSGAEHVHVATGYSGTGMTWGTLAGMLVSDAIQEIDNPWSRLYDATRVKPFAQAGRYVKENVDYPKQLVADRMARGQVASADEIPPGQGRLMRDGGMMLAVYHDPSGELVTRSAVCTHLGCYVQWNEAEKTWDCPCHGSRFDPRGCVVNGPAVKELGDVDRVVLDEQPVPSE